MYALHSVLFEKNEISRSPHARDRGMLFASSCMDYVPRIATVHFPTASIRILHGSCAGRRSPPRRRQRRAAPTRASRRRRLAGGFARSVAVRLAVSRRRRPVTCWCVGALHRSLALCQGRKVKAHVGCALLLGRARARPHPACIANPAHTYRSPFSVLEAVPAILVLSSRFSS